MDETKQSHNYLEACDEAGDLIRKGSDILTSSVERYVITGNPVFRDRYFLEAKRDKNREAGLEKVKDFPNAEMLRRDLDEAMTLDPGKADINCFVNCVPNSSPGCLS